MNPNRQTIDNLTGNAHIDRMRGVPTAEDVQAMDSRNRDRAREAARRMGTSYALHPANRVKRLPAPVSATERKHTLSWLEHFARPTV